MDINDKTHVPCKLADFVQSPAKPKPLADGQILLVVDTDGITLSGKYFAAFGNWVELT